MKNRLMRYITGLIAVCMVVFISCNHLENSKNSRLMQQAQLLAEQNPDSALVLLDAVNTATISDVERAEYTLLRVQAKDKAGKDISADTAIFSVRDYFLAKKNDEKAALACYYAGRVLQAQGNANDAKQAYLEATRRLSSIINQDRQEVLIDSHTGKSYYEHKGGSKFLLYYRKAMEQINPAEENVYAGNAIDVSDSLNTYFDSLLYYFNKVTKMPAYQNHKMMQTSVVRDLGIMAIHSNNPQEAIDLILQALQRTTNVDVPTKSYLYHCVSRAFERLNCPDSASFYLTLSGKLNESIPKPPMPDVYKAQIIKKNGQILFLCILTGCLVAVVVLLTLFLHRKKTIIQKNSAINSLTHEVDDHRKQVSILKEQIERNQEIIQQLENKKNAGTNEENNSAIDAKIKEREEYVEQLENKLRLSYTYRLKAHLEIRKDYDNFKRRNKQNMNFQLVDKFFYGNSDKLCWETIIPLMPDKFEEKIKMNYDKLNENEIKLCCLLLFDVDKFDLPRLLPSYKKESISAIKRRIKEKTGKDDIIKTLMPLLH